MNVYLVRIHDNNQTQPHIVGASSWQVALRKGTNFLKVTQKVGENITVTCRLLAKNKTRKEYFETQEKLGITK